MNAQPYMGPLIPLKPQGAEEIEELEDVEEFYEICLLNMIWLLYA